MLTYDLQERGSLTLYEYLYQCIRNDILSGAIEPGEKLPSKRRLAEHLRISVITVETAYDQLRSEGYIFSKPQRGFFASSLERVDRAPIKEMIRTDESVREEISENAIDMSAFPLSVWRKIAREVLSETDPQALAQTTSQGQWELRLAISDYLGGYRGIDADPKRIIVGAGSEYLYLLLAQLLPNEAAMAIESPGHNKILRIYERAGRTCIPLPLDEEGLSYDALRSTEARIAHVSPAHHFPTGIVMPIARRQQLLQWASKVDGYIIEDDYDSELRFSGRPIPSMYRYDRDDRVIYINTFSQTIFPALRVSYMVLPEHLYQRYREQYAFYTCPVSSLDQQIVARFLGGGFYEKHLLRMRGIYRRRRNRIIDAFEHASFSDCISIPRDPAGLHFLMHIDSGCEQETIREHGRKIGLNLNFLSDYMLQDDKHTSPTKDESAQTQSIARHTLVINYGGLSEEDVDEWIASWEKLFSNI